MSGLFVDRWRYEKHPQWELHGNGGLVVLNDQPRPHEFHFTHSTRRRELVRPADLHGRHMLGLGSSAELEEVVIETDHYRCVGCGILDRKTRRK